MSDPVDARVAAWIGAWDCLDAASKLCTQHPKADLAKPLDQLYRSAEIYTALASAPQEVGEIAGALLGRRKEDADRQSAMIRKADWSDWGASHE